MGIHDICTAIRDNLRTNLTDPLDRYSSSGGQWIHYDTLDNISRVGKTPALFIEHVPGTGFYKAIGSVTHDIIQLKVNIHIAVRNTDKGVMSAAEVNSSEMMDKLIDQTRTQLSSVGYTISPTYIKTIDLLDLGGKWNINRDTKATTMVYGVQEA